MLVQVNAIYTVFSTGIENEPCNTKLYREHRSKPKDKVRISLWVGMVGLKDEIANLNDSYGHKGFGLIDLREFSENDLELIDFPDPKPDTGLELIDCKDFSESKPDTGLELIDCKDFSKSKPETAVFSEPKHELDLIDFRDFCKLDFSEPELKLEYSPKLKAVDTEMSLRVGIESSGINKTETFFGFRQV